MDRLAPARLVCVSGLLWKRLGVGKMLILGGALLFGVGVVGLVMARAGPAPVLDVPLHLVLRDGVVRAIPAARLSAWWYVTQELVVVRVDARRDAEVLGCVGAGLPLEGDEGVEDGWRLVLAEGWSGWVRASQLSAGWHAGALGGSVAALVEC